MTNRLVEKYYRTDKLPHIWCPGCTHGISMNAIIHAIDEMGYHRDDVVIVSGIGCSSRAPGYMDFNTLHTTHGRALTFATGIKMANPRLKVIVISGDGDATAIGGNHFIHACRRNIDITTIIFNNNIYGMTGGQYSPMTPISAYGTTAPYGNIDPTFDICKLAEAAGASYVARGTAYHTKALINLIIKGMENKGFSVIEAVSNCPTYFGRKNRVGDAVDMMKHLKEISVNIKTASKMSAKELEEKIIIGEFKNETRPEYVEEYHRLIERVKEEE
ncbi:2-oxoacid:ferredoxin oxidoreductase subunit beta [Garciella nitratireducens]|uniref:2-oxoglutarate ferredoxin oxidoreductase, beta subunit n=1 Tax=Garciella nitratireducens DSM 15102 TaxID=1121911 RepID=A0A1T4JV19_9FIRM|nr:2-oxoacid:ferredoxin oxidoreductase subunit beta [Garciella nitratireducens]RBP45592.1 2-oxoglutarate ferredoxin oxidoreductase subunit beta [Garciella nitratireducens]SJZ34016.1 2-oxoglutarate ferredoxin oxidoreductase, beta subunit [Garciella nitratireducens DSM 15102]